MLMPPKASNSGEIAQRWMEMVLGEKFQREFTVVLRAGVALCDLANRVFKALGMKDKVVVFDASEGGDAAYEEDGGHDALYASSRPPRGATQNIRSYLRYACVSADGSRIWFLALLWVIHDLTPVWCLCFVVVV